MVEGVRPNDEDASKPDIDLPDYGIPVKNTGRELNRALLPEQFRDVLEVVTSKGSRYKVLPDGKTQRSKATTGETFEPHDLLVFLPTFDQLKTAPDGVLYPGMREVLGRYNNQKDFEQTLLFYVQNKGMQVKPAKFEVVDQKGKVLRNNYEVASAEGRINLKVTKGDQVVFVLPLFKKPKLGTVTFDQRFVGNEDGTIRAKEQHIGNVVTEIVTAD